MVDVPRDSFLQQYSDRSIYIYMIIMPANYDIEVHLFSGKVCYFLRLQQQQQINVYN